MVEINNFLKVWKPTLFVLDYLPKEGFCLNISLEVNDPFVKKHFMMDYGKPFCEDIPSTYHKLKDFVDKALSMYNQSVAYYERALERTQNKIEALHKNPMSRHAGSWEYISLENIKQDYKLIQGSIETGKSNISLAESMIRELEEIKQEFEIKD